MRVPYSKVKSDERALSDFSAQADLSVYDLDFVSFTNGVCGAAMASVKRS